MKVYSLGICICWLCLLFKPTLETCSASQLPLITNRNYRNIFIYQCYADTVSIEKSRIGVAEQPTIPETYLKQATQYTELNLSPNLYTSLPISYLCQFKYITALDMSMNQLNSLQNAFITLNCLTALNSINFSSNFIASPILASDFDDNFAAQIQSLNLTNNSISYIESRAFLTSDGTRSRFPQLTYLGLALNKIKVFDVLWPLTIPSSNLQIDMKINPITTLENEFGLTFNNILFAYDMTGNRHVIDIYY
jgi:hypothetical protein